MIPLVIRDARRAPLRELARHTFGQRMVEHLLVFSPQHCAGIGEAAVRSVVIDGVERAARYGFTQHGPVRLFLEMMLLMGSHFDTDPQLPPPIARALQAGDGTDQLDRADRVHAELLGHMRAALGVDNRHARAAIARLCTMASMALALDERRLESDVLRLFEQVYPERCALAEPAALARLVVRARSLACGGGGPRRAMRYRSAGAADVRAGPSLYRRPALSLARARWSAMKATTRSCGPTVSNRRPRRTSH